MVLLDFCQTETLIWPSTLGRGYNVLDPKTFELDFIAQPLNLSGVFARGEFGFGL